MAVVRTTLRVKRNGASLEAWGEAIRDPEEPLAAVATAVHEIVDANIGAAVDPWGGEWAPRSPVTIERGGGGPSAVQALRRAIIVRADRVRSVIDVDRFKARIFGKGAAGKLAWGRGSAPQPARAILPTRRDRSADLPESMRDAVRAAFREKMREVVRRLTRR